MGRTAVAAAIVAMVFLVGCSSSEGETVEVLDEQVPAEEMASTEEAPPGDGELRPAEEAKAERDIITVGAELGELYELSDGSVVIVSAIEPFPEPEPQGRAFVATVRVENPTAGDLFAPELELRCPGSDAGGPWFAESTYGLGDLMPPGTFVDGDLILGRPDPDCPDAFLEASAVGVTIGEPIEVRWPLP